MNNTIITLTKDSYNQIKSNEFINEIPSIYNTIKITDYIDTHIFYIGFIGCYNHNDTLLYLYKFGITYDMTIRELTNHTKSFNLFHTIYINGSNKNRTIETLVKTEMNNKKILCDVITYENKRQTEIFAVESIEQFNNIFDIIKGINKSVDDLDKKRIELSNQNSNKELAKLNEIKHNLKISIENTKQSEFNYLREQEIKKQKEIELKLIKYQIINKLIDNDPTFKLDDIEKILNKY